MSQIEGATSPVRPRLELLQEAYAAACEFNQPIDTTAVEYHLSGFYRELKLPEPKFKGFASLDKYARAARGARDARDAWDAWGARDARDARAARAAWDARAAWAARDARAARGARDARDAWDAWDATYISAIVLGAVELNLAEEIQIWSPIFEAMRSGLWVFTPAYDCCYWVQKPKIRRLGNRLHCETGPAFELPEQKLWFWRGVLVPQHVVENPGAITAADIESESNLEVRRIKLERFGQARYLQESGAEEIHRDDFGVLYRKEIAGDEPLVMVKVANSTPEPDGSFKDYFLRVPPQTRRAREAVAWTFGKSETEYNPSEET